MLICVCLRILASSRIPRYDLRRQNPSFLRWFCHTRACYSLWLAAPRQSWWSGSLGAYRGDCGSPKEVVVTLFMVWASPCRRWQTETPSEHLLSMWHERWHNPLWVSQRGLGVITKSPTPREKIRLPHLLLSIYFMSFAMFSISCMLVLFA
jgi:hypothetical protein